VTAIVRIRDATAGDADLVAPLFDAYRQFYERPPDPAVARAFLLERLTRGESVVYVAEEGGKALGFVQLYPLFSSTALRPGCSWLLNDLYVVPEARGRGIGRALMQRARRLAVENGACALELATADSNVVARGLYESLGYRRDERFVHYALELIPESASGSISNESDQPTRP
jgi:ribosomal protein S18 acetylase RimI-like enzyme